MARKFLTPIDLNKLELRNAAIQNLAEAPGTPSIGQIYFDTDESRIKVWTGIAWENVGGSTEQIQDAVADLVSASTGIRVIYDDDANTLGIENIGILAVAGTENQVLVNNGTSVLNSASVTISLPETIHRDLQGDVTGNADTASAWQTPRTITLSGDLSGSASVDGSQDVTITALIEPDSVALGTDTVGNYVQGIQGTENEITVSGSGGESASVTIGLPENVTIANNLVVGGSFTVSGSTTFLNVETLEVEDNIVLLNSGVTGEPVLDSGIEIERGTSSNVELIWKESADQWQVSDGTSYFAIARKVSGNIGNNSASAIAVTHNLNTLDVQVQIYTSGAPYDTVEADIERTDSNTVTLRFAVAPGVDEYRVVVTG